MWPLSICYGSIRIHRSNQLCPGFMKHGAISASCWLTVQIAGWNCPINIVMFGRSESKFPCNWSFPRSVAYNWVNLLDKNNAPCYLIKKGKEKYKIQRIPCSIKAIVLYISPTYLQLRPCSHSTNLTSEDDETISSIRSPVYPFKSSLNEPLVFSQFPKAFPIHLMLGEISMDYLTSR